MAHPSIGESELRTALKALDLCLQDYAWGPGENYLDTESLYCALQARGITLAVIETLLESLIQHNVFQPHRQSMPAGTSYENGVNVFRSEAESTHFLATTRGLWFDYLTEATRANAEPVTADPADRRHPIRADGDGSNRFTHRPAPQAVSEANSSPSSAIDLEFDDFSRKQRLLLLALRGKEAVAVNDVMRAVYGQKRTSMSTLERLLSRTNQNLTNRGYRLEIKRKSNTLRLQPI